MNIFSALRVYAGKWNVKSSRAFTSDEIAAVESATVWAVSLLYDEVRWDDLHSIGPEFHKGNWRQC